MSWPYGMGFINPVQYINCMDNVYQPFFSNQLQSNHLLNSFPLNCYNMAQNYAMFSTNGLDIQNNYAPQQINHVIPATNTNNSNIQEQYNPRQESSQNQSDISNQSSFQLEDVRLVRFRRRRRTVKPKNIISHNSSLRNDTKNIPKNYGKAVLAYIQKNSRQTKQLLEIHDVDYLQFMMAVKGFKSKINTIHDLRQMWGENNKEDKLKMCLRILSYHFMRKKCIPYIFNSRVKNFHTHIKYRKKIMQGIQNPENFTKIKQF